MSTRFLRTPALSSVPGAGGLNSNNIGPLTHAGRTAISLLTGPSASMTFGLPDAQVVCASATDSTAAAPRALELRASVSLRAGSGGTALAALVGACVGSADSACIDIVEDAGRVKVLVVHAGSTATDTIDLAPWTADGRYHTLEIRVFLDTVQARWDGGAWLSTGIRVSSSTLMMLDLRETYPAGGIVPAWAWYSWEIREIDDTTTIGISRTNGARDSGTLLAIRRSAVESGDTTGSWRWTMTITDGVFSDAIPAGTEVLMVKTLADNSGGSSVRMCKASDGTWTRGWS